jgi:hypothetical protein
MVIAITETVQTQVAVTEIVKLVGHITVIPLLEFVNVGCPMVMRTAAHKAAPTVIVLLIVIVETFNVGIVILLDLRIAVIVKCVHH